VEVSVRLAIESALAPLPDDRRTEIVERKGLGHPDSICDALAEALSLELARFYRDHVGRILHHNVDKALLAAGATRPRFGGGAVLAPLQILLAGRATMECGGSTVPLAELVEDVSRRWLRQNLRALDADAHVVVTNLVRPGSSELVELFDEQGHQRLPLANDTSCGVGYAPLSAVERLVLAVEKHLNSPETHAAAPALGEDVKVMAVRHEDSIGLTIACAMIDSAVSDLGAYAKARQSVAECALQAASEITSLPVAIEVNAADDLAAGRVYLTVTGTSGEAGDDGQAGRGNRANGLITPGRAMTIESLAGKNPVSHVGKLYNLAASLAAQRLVDALPGVRGAECCMVSRIGCPIDEPQLVEVKLAGVKPERDAELQREAEAIVRDELGRLPRLADELLTGSLGMDRWPLRT
jgi:S-adenosylmethionine synthetase